MADGLARLLDGFCERLEKKAFLKRLTRDWDSRVRISPAEGEGGVTLIFARDRIPMVAWGDTDPVNLVITGGERDLVQLLSGNEWDLLHAQQKVAARGAIRDQLKWEALLRLTCATN
ncbi:hypothetical protein EDM56_17830 [Brevibacillus fluminis]|uniref:SCP2 domain-containing protein n=1 Tax=Brevibacillus fluminis TaxID=511487 RepID=A0A3M8DCJ7_9BACL|nr:hypothetical protein [Brevibacillus fluminis]RNB85860.1 hypothetical protein EDM56_17830 [Brevibacillus fluminis]